MKSKRKHMQGSCLINSNTFNNSNKNFKKINIHMIRDKVSTDVTNRRFRKMCGCCRAVRNPINKLWEQTTGKQLFDIWGRFQPQLWRCSQSQLSSPPSLGCSIPSWRQHHSHKEFLNPCSKCQSSACTATPEKREGQTSANGMWQQDEQWGISARAPKLQGRQVKTTNRTRVMRDLWWIPEKKQIGPFWSYKTAFCTS